MASEIEVEPLDPRVLRRVAAEHDLDQRTLTKALRGMKIKGARAQRTADEAVADYRRRIAEAQLPDDMTPHPGDPE